MRRPSTIGPSMLEFLSILRLNMRQNIVLVHDYIVQRCITQYNEELEDRIAMFGLGDGAFEAPFQPELVTVGTEIDCAESVDGWCTISLCHADNAVTIGG